LESGEDIDEIKQYLERRYIFFHEAFQRVLEFKVNSISKNIIRLPVHLPNKQNVTFHAPRSIETSEFFKVSFDIQQSIENGTFPQNLLTYRKFLGLYA
jgi:hypothetical protein